MKKSSLLKVLAVSAFLIPVRAGAADYPEVRVIARTPYGATQDISAAAAITATFNQPMVALTSAEKAGLACPAELFETEVADGKDSADLKAVKGRCRWQGTQVLAFEPETPLKPASRYTVKIPRGFKSENSGQELAEDETWTFDTPRPSVLHTAPHNNQKWVAPESVLFAAFDQPMDPVRARRYVQLLEGIAGEGGGEMRPRRRDGLEKPEGGGCSRNKRR